MTLAKLYDEDIVLWSEEQGRVLRSLERIRSALPNELDLENVAEEIESVGRSETAAVESLLRLLMLHVIKIAMAPDAPSVRHWFDEAANFRAEALSRFAPSMAERIDLARAWRLARKQARVALDDRGNVTAELPEFCPYAMADLIDEDGDLDALVARLERR
jgi:hypothetical protein